MISDTEGAPVTQKEARTTGVPSSGARELSPGPVSPVLVLAAWPQAAYPLGVEVVHGLGDGAQHIAGLPLREVTLPEDAVQQLSAAHQLHHQIHELPVVIDLGGGERSMRSPWRPPHRPTRAGLPAMGEKGSPGGSPGQGRGWGLGALPGVKARLRVKVSEWPFQSYPTWCLGKTSFNHLMQSRE